MKRRLVADVPVGVLLSGGLDSSLIIGLLAEAGRRTFAPIRSASRPSDREPGDEYRYSDLIARHYGTIHEQIHIRRQEELLGALPAAIAAMAEPMVSHDCVAFYLLSQAVAQAQQGGAERAGRG